MNPPAASRTSAAKKRSLLTRRGFDDFVATLPAVTLHEQWDASVAKVGGKVFALAGMDGGHVVFKVSETAFAGLTTLAGVGQAPYFAKGQWVAVNAGADISDDDIGAYLREAHRIIAGKLTRRIRAEFGLTDDDGRIAQRGASDKPALSRRSST